MRISKKFMTRTRSSGMNTNCGEITVTSRDKLVSLWVLNLEAAVESCKISAVAFFMQSVRMCAPNTRVLG